MLSNVINLGAEPICAHDLQCAMSAIRTATAPEEYFGYGRAILTAPESSAKLECSTLIILRGGVLTLKTTDGEPLILCKGEVATLPAGEIMISAEAAECIIIPLYHDNPKLILEKLDLDHPMSTGGSPNPELLTSDLPETARHEFYDCEDLSWGIWKATPYSRRVMTYSFYEIMALLSGEVTFANPDEGSVTFSAGDILLVRPNAVASWDNAVNLEKFWVIRSE